MRMLATSFSICLFGVLSCYALPPPIWRNGENPDADGARSPSVQTHLPSLEGALTSATSGLASLPISPPSTSALPKLPLKIPSTSPMPTIPVHLPSIHGMQSPVTIVAVDPSKMVPGIKGPLPFNPVAIGSHFLKPVVDFPFVVADEGYQIPLQTWDSLKSIIDAAVHLPKEEISAGHKAVEGFFSTLSG